MTPTTDMAQAVAEMCQDLGSDSQDTTEELVKAKELARDFSEQIEKIFDMVIAHSTWMSENGSEGNVTKVEEVYMNATEKLLIHAQIAKVALAARIKELENGQ